jgi:hypothetical protein
VKRFFRWSAGTEDKKSTLGISQLVYYQNTFPGMNIHIPKIKFEGILSIGKFRPENRKYAGWNLSGDLQGCVSFIALLEQIQASPASSHLIPICNSQ